MTDAFDSAAPEIPRRKVPFFEASPLSIAARYIGVHENAGGLHNPQILAWLQRVAPWASEDEVPWCSAFVFEMAWLFDLPRPQKKAAAARSWLTVGVAIDLADAVPASDVVVFKRGTGKQPGPEILDAPGHVGFFVSQTPAVGGVQILGGNQSDSVSIANCSAATVLGVRRLIHPDVQAYRYEPVVSTPGGRN